MKHPFLIFLLFLCGGFSAVAQLYYLPRRFRLFIIQDRLLHGRFIVILGGIVVAVFFLFA